MSIKRGHRENTRIAIQRFRARFTDEFAPFFDNDTILIPVPRSSAQIVQGGVRPAHLIAEVLVSQGLGHEVNQCLTRVKTVPKSAFCRPGERPDVYTLYDSLVVERGLFDSEKILIVDDVVTVGRNLIASATRVQEAYPNAEVRAFTLIRHQWDEITDVEEPVVGHIVCNNYGTVQRN